MERFIWYCSNSWIIDNSEEILRRNKMYIKCAFYILSKIIRLLVCV